MTFNKNILNQLKNAGWFPGRNTKAFYKKVKKWNTFPAALKDFLCMYGNLSIKCFRESTAVEVYLKVLPQFSEYEDQEDYEADLELFGTPLFPFARYEPDFDIIGLDANGTIYKTGDNHYKIAPNLEAALEVLILNNWDNGFLVLDEKTMQWKASKIYNGWEEDVSLWISAK